MVVNVTTARRTRKINREGFLCEKQVKDRGWTHSLLKQFFKVPDGTTINPCYHSAPPMKLYAIARVEAIEATAGFQQVFAKAAIRSQAAQKAAATRLENARDADEYGYANHDPHEYDGQ